MERSPLRRLPDRALRWGLTGLAAAILAIIGFFFVRLYIESRPAFSKFGVLGFVFDNDWDVSRAHFGALPLLVGTLITSATALIIGVPVAVASAVYVTELCPRVLRAPLTAMVELLAAVPSVVYGLWGFFFLVPKLRPAEQWFADTFSFLPFVGGSVAGPNYFIAGLILAIMIVPIVSAISREVMATVPADHKEAALAPGAPRWELIRTAVLRYSRAGCRAHERAAARQPAAPPARPHGARAARRRDGRRPDPARADPLLRDQEGPGRVERELLHQRPVREVLRRPGRDPQRHPGDAG